jgi:hypothetical protein
LQVYTAIGPFGSPNQALKQKAVELAHLQQDSSQSGDNTTWKWYIKFQWEGNDNSLTDTPRNTRQGLTVRAQKQSSQNPLDSIFVP